MQVLAAPSSHARVRPQSRHVRVQPSAPRPIQRSSQSAVAFSRSHRSSEGRAGVQANSPNIQGLLAGLTGTYGEGSTRPDPLVSGMNELRRRSHSRRGELEGPSVSAIGHLDESHRRMYAATLGHLENLRSGLQAAHGSQTGQDQRYMMAVLHSAADISGGDPNRFTDLVHFAFNDEMHTGGRDIMRSLAGGGYNLAGSTLENTHHDLLPRDNQAGYDPNVRETQIGNLNNTVTHHYAEFLRMGYHNGQVAPGVMQDLLDNPQTNPADNRSGHFASMVGDALRRRQITVQQAVDLTEYAYIGRNGRHTSMWPGDQVDGAENWNINDWVSEMRTGRQPHQQERSQARAARLAQAQSLAQSLSSIVGMP